MLVRRHTGLVYGVCRRVLGQEQDAEDALQATFLILARKAASIQKQQSLASWLHGVALRTALAARKSAMRRRKYEERAERQQCAPPSPVSETALRELQVILDQEVQALPERWRAPFVLCCWEGKSRAEAALELGWKEGTVSSRLAQARLRLQQRLARRGVTLTAALSAIMLSPHVASAATLADTTARAVLAVASGDKVREVSAHALALAEGVMSTMSRTSATKVVTLCLVLALAALGLGAVVQATALREPAQAAQQSKQGDAGPGEKVLVKLDDVLREAATAVRASAPPRSGVLEEIAAVQAQAGNKDAARKTFAEVFPILQKAAEVDEPHQKAIVLARLARAQHRAGERAAAKKSFAMAVQVARSITDINNTADALQLIARVQAECGDLAGARETASGVEPAFYRGQVLADIAIAQAVAGDVKGAIAEGRALGDPFHQTLFWLGIAEWWAGAKDKAQAVAALRSGRAALEKVSEVAQQPALLVRIALLEARVDSAEAARNTYDTAQALARQHRAGVMSPDNFLLRLAVVQANQGNHDGAKKLLDEALRLSGTEGGVDALAVHIALGEWQTAYRAIHGAPWTETQRAEQLRTLAHAQAQSGDAGSAYAWAAKEAEPLVKAMALLGVAQGMLARQQR
jgi:RNA polymerase sigma factor (sigma-70 family)